MDADNGQGAHQGDQKKPVSSTDATSATRLTSDQLSDDTVTEAINKAPQSVDASVVKVKTEWLPVEIPATSLSKKQFQCRVCLVVFSKRWNCVSHMRAHARVRPVFFCPRCGKKCSKKSELDIHLRIHTGEKPFACQECQRCFVRQGQLNSHMRIHTGVRPHMCHDCGAFFASTSNLKRHQRCHTKACPQKVPSKPKLVRGLRYGNAADSYKVEEGWHEADSLPTKVVISRHSAPSLQNVIQVSNPQQNHKADKLVKVTVATNTDYDVVRTGAKQLPPGNSKRESNPEAATLRMTQFAPQPIKPIPAITASESIIVIDPGMEDALKEKKIHATDVLPLEKKTEGTLLENSSRNEASEVAISLLALESSEGVGQITFPAGGEAEPSSGALSSVMQVDWSFLLEDTGVQVQGPSAEQVETLPEVLSQSGLPSGSAAAISSASFQLDGSVPVSQMSGSGLPIIMPIPHIPAVNLTHIHQDMVDNVDASEIQNVSTSVSGPVTVVVEHLYHDHYQMVQEMPAASASDSGQLFVDGQAFPQPHTITLIPQDSHSLLNNENSAGEAAEEAMAVAQEQKLKPFVCDVCSQCFARRWYLTVHRNAHFRQRSFTCDQCPAKFSRVGNLNRHKQTHTGAKPFQCGKCEARFGSKYRLLEHERRHDGLKPYRCDICQCCFTDCSSLRRHQLAHKGDNLQHTCDVCGAQFRTLHSLTFHLKLHGSDDGTGCTEKGITLDESESTPRDMPIVPLHQSQVCEAAKGTPCVLKSTDAQGRCVFLCSVCHKAFPYSAACRQHILCHTGSRPFKCTDCGAKFSRKADAKRHTHVHQREKRHTCSKCGEKFQTKSRLILHSEEHLGLASLNIPCAECGQKFSKERSVKIHRQVFHRRYLPRFSCERGAGVGDGGDRKENDGGENKAGDEKEGIHKSGENEENNDGVRNGKSERVRNEEYDKGNGNEQSDVHDDPADDKGSHRSDSNRSTDESGQVCGKNHEAVSDSAQSDAGSLLSPRLSLPVGSEADRKQPCAPTNDGSLLALPSVPAVQSTLRDATIPQRAAARKRRDFLASLTPRRNARKNIVKSAT